MDLARGFGLLNVKDGFEKLSLSKQQLIIMITIIKISRFISPHPKHLYNELVNCILSAPNGWVASLCISADLGELSCSLVPRICVISYSVICFEFKVVRGNSPAISYKWFHSEQVFSVLEHLLLKEEKKSLYLLFVVQPFTMYLGRSLKKKNKKFQQLKH